MFLQRSSGCCSSLVILSFDGDREISQIGKETGTKSSQFLLQDFQPGAGISWKNFKKFLRDGTALCK